METIHLRDAETEIQEMVQGNHVTRILAVLILLIWGMWGCNSVSVYEKAVKLPDSGWHKDSALVFKPVIEDTSAVLNLGFSISHRNNYPYSNLWLFIEVDGPDGVQQVDTMEFFLAEPDGEWIGKGGDSGRKLFWLYKGNVKLICPGGYSFKVYQGMRSDCIQGIREMSFWIEEKEAE